MKSAAPVAEQGWEICQVLGLSCSRVHRQLAVPQHPCLGPHPRRLGKAGVGGDKQWWPPVRPRIHGAREAGAVVLSTWFHMGFT